MANRKKTSKPGSDPKKNIRSKAAGKSSRVVGAGLSGGISTSSLSGGVKLPSFETRKGPVATPSRAGATELMSEWSDFQRNLNSQFSGMMETQQRYYADLVEKWKSISDDISERISQSGGADEALNEMQRKWNDYQASMKKRIESFLEMENETFESLNKKWKDHSENVGESIKTLVSGKDPKEVQRKILESWTEMTSEMNERFKKGVDAGNVGIKDLRDTWMKLMKDLEGQTREIRDATPEITEAVEQWREATWKMNREIMEYADNTVDQMSKLQSSWYNSVTDMGNQMLNGLMHGMEKAQDAVRRK